MTPIDRLLRRPLRAQHKPASLGRLLFDALANYTAFADRFGCGIGAMAPFWERDLLLNDGSVLRLRGLTSVLASDASDDVNIAKLVLGTAQAQPLREDGVEHCVLCHHPPQWLYDQDAVVVDAAAEWSAAIFATCARPSCAASCAFVRGLSL